MELSEAKIFPAETDANGEGIFYKFKLLRSRNINIYGQSVTTSLQLLGDVGAVYSTLWSLFSIFLFIFLKVDVVSQNLLLNGIFERVESENMHKSKFSYLQFVVSESGHIIMCCRKKSRFRHPRNDRRVGLRRIERQLDIIRFLRKFMELQIWFKA